MGSLYLNFHLYFLFIPLYNYYSWWYPGANTAGIYNPIPNYEHIVFLNGIRVLIVFTMETAYEILVSNPILTNISNNNR